ncbi:oxygenase MpaB family protein [uncultured Fluviicola sp.]|uniref:oxygenase MpaB family protein n=1 Tax=uncultured Fluviicola sp. TaxID=463303 RepID=UPI0025E659EF|nr:oxygenase MpaB family protein [uncultured Fluviicola sp.]
MIPTRFYYPSPGFSIYWKNGNGKKLAEKMTGTFPEKKEIEQLVPRLFETDKLADRVIREVYQVHGFKQADQWINQLLDGEKPAHVPDSLLQIIEQITYRPDWLNESLLEQGASLCRRSGSLGLMVLRNYCLMGGYESSAINKPLVFTGALKKGAAKRLTETTEFWVRIVGENAITMPQIGLKECLKIRLMHAYARVSILEEGKWQEENWGAPLNQWDMLATNLGFSIIFLDGLRKLGMKPTEAEIQGLFHFWKYVGYLLGTPESYFPETESDAIRAIYAWTITQAPADEDTLALAKALTLEPLDGPFPDKNWQKNLVYKTHLGYNWFFLGKSSCETMQLPQTAWRIFPPFQSFFVNLGQAFVFSSEKSYQRSILRNRRAQTKVVNAYLESHGRKKVEDK